MEAFNKKKVLLMINYTSGTGNGKRDLVKIVDELSKRNCEVTVYPIMPKYGLDSETIIQNRHQDFDIFVCYGGDGSLNYVVNGMMANKVDKPIGYIPGGSTNDFSKSFDNAITIEEKCKAIAEGKEFAYDLGLFNEHRYFNYVAAFGAFTQTSYSASTNVKNVLGYGAYALNALASLSESFSFREHMIITHDGAVDEGTFIYGGISNSLSIGGMKLPFYKDAALDDGKFEVLLVKSPDNVGELAMILNDLASGQVNDNYVYSFKAEHIRIQSDNEITWTLDGEFGGSFKDTSIDIQPKAMRIMTKK